MSRWVVVVLEISDDTEGGPREVHRVVGPFRSSAAAVDYGLSLDSEAWDYHVLLLERP